MKDEVSDEEFYEAIRRLMREECMTLKEIAGEMGVVLSTVCRWANQRNAPSSTTKKKLLTLLDKRRQAKRAWYRPIVIKFLARLPQLSTDDIKKLAEAFLDELLQNPPKRGDPGDSGLTSLSFPANGKLTFVQKLFQAALRLILRR